MPRCPTCQRELPQGVAACPEDGTPIGADDALIGRLVGKYRVLGPFPGDPGLGLYRANQVDLDREVALKILSADDESHAKRFIREARALAAVSHPNIVHVFDFGRTDTGGLYMAMEPLHGMPLDRYLDEEGPLVERRAIRIARAIGEGLSSAHTHGIIHRDLKPANIIVAGSPASPSVKIFNFGIAKVAAGMSGNVDGETKTGLTLSRVVMGSPWYVSPEQAMDETVDARSDLYSLGVILYEMLMGNPPFHGRTAIEILSKHVREEPAVPRPEGPVPHPGLERLTLALLAKERDSRPDSAEQVVQELYRIDRELTGGTMITGRPERLDQDADRSKKEERRPAHITKEVEVDTDGETFLDPSVLEATHPVKTPSVPRRIVIGGKRVRRPGSQTRGRREDTKVLKGLEQNGSPPLTRMEPSPEEHALDPDSGIDEDEITAPRGDDDDVTALNPMPEISPALVDPGPTPSGDRAGALAATAFAASGLGEESDEQRTPAIPIDLEMLSDEEATEIDSALLNNDGETVSDSHVLPSLARSRLATTARADRPKMHRETVVDPVDFLEPDEADEAEERGPADDLDEMTQPMTAADLVRPRRSTIDLDDDDVEIIEEDE